jgi:hypothetical protein
MESIKYGLVINEKKTSILNVPGENNLNMRIYRLEI